MTYQRRSTRWIMLASVLSVLAYAEPDPPVSGGTPAPSSWRVPLVRLLAKPVAYDGMKVSVTGYINTSFEDEAIYLSQEDYENALIPNSLRLNLSSKIKAQVKSGQLVEVEGVFKYNHVEYTGQFGVIVSITRVAPWRAREGRGSAGTKRGSGCL